MSSHRTATQFKQQGFTLIELLVVIAIIGLLMTVVIASLSFARKQARDRRREADIRVLQQALSLYYYDHGYFPTSGFSPADDLEPDNSWSNSNHKGSWDALLQQLSPYISKLPHDPIESPTGWAGHGVNYSYAYYSQSYGCSADWYMLVYQLEIAKGPDPGASSCDAEWKYGGWDADTYIKTIGFIK